jgi:hypothetical protein
MINKQRHGRQHQYPQLFSCCYGQCYGGQHLCSMCTSQKKAVSYHHAVADCNCKQQRVPAVSRLLWSITT